MADARISPHHQPVADVIGAALISYLSHRPLGVLPIGGAIPGWESISRELRGRPIDADLCEKILQLGAEVLAAVSINNLVADDWSAPPLDDVEQWIHHLVERGFVATVHRSHENCEPRFQPTAEQLTDEFINLVMVVLHAVVFHGRTSHNDLCTSESCIGRRLAAAVVASVPVETVARVGEAALRMVGDAYAKCEGASTVGPAFAWKMVAIS